MDPERHLLALRRESAALADAARLGLDARVPSCPAWDVAALLGHVAHEFHWTLEIVRSHADAELPEEELVPGGDVVAWFEEVAAELVEVLTNEGEDAPAWNWSERDFRAAFWMRRMANEVAVHRWDAQLAHGVARIIEPELAVDAIDELLRVILPYHLAERPVDGLAGTALVEATDTGDRWWVRLAPDASDVARSGTPTPDATLRANASDLLLALWGRDVPYDASGDERIARVLTR